MSSFDFSLSGYLANPLSNHFETNIINNDTINSFRKMISRRFDISIIRWYHIKEIRNILINKKILNDFILHLLFSLKPKAFMKDSGEMYFTLGSLFKTSRVNLKVLCHELAHMWLSQQSFYLDLKKLNKEFKQKYSHLDECYLASPIEFYAMVISYEMMKDILCSLKEKWQIDKWSVFVEEENKKIEKLKELIKNI